jgi:hypothetical protein
MISNKIQNLHQKDLKEIIQKLMLTEIELVYLVIILDDFGWLCKNLTVSDNILMTGFYVKVIFSYNFIFSTLCQTIQHFV